MLQILLLDDSPSMRKVIQMAFSQHENVSISAAGSKEQAIAFFNDNRPDIVICYALFNDTLDIEFLKQVYSQCPATIILLESLELVGQLREEGFFYFLKKPFAGSELLKLVEGICQQFHPAKVNEVFPNNEDTAIVQAPSSPEPDPDPQHDRNTINHLQMNNNMGAEEWPPKANFDDSVSPHTVSPPTPPIDSPPQSPRDDLSMSGKHRSLVETISSESPFHASLESGLGGQEEDSQWKNNAHSGHHFEENPTPQSETQFQFQPRSSESPEPVDNGNGVGMNGDGLSEPEFSMDIESLEQNFRETQTSVAGIPPPPTNRDFKEGDYGAKPPLPMSPQPPQMPNFSPNDYCI